MISPTEQILVRHERALKESLRIRPARRLVFAFDVLTPPENQRWEQKINGYHTDCGCKAGAATLLAAAVISPLFLYLLDARKPRRLGLEILTWAIFVLCGALMGKVIGIIRARRLLKRALSQMTTLTRERRRESPSCSES
jgi:hypothetical protein